MSIPVIIPYGTSSPGRRKRAKDLGRQSFYVGSADHTDEPPTREDTYVTVLLRMTNQWTSPIPLTLLHYTTSLSPWLLLISLPYTINIVFPFRIPSSSRPPIIHSSFPPSTSSSHPPSLIPHRSVTSKRLPDHCRVPPIHRRHCQPLTAYTLSITA